jgi:hypothetical protein
VTAPVVAAALLFWVGVFMVYFTAAGTTPLEFFFGAFEPPPADLGQWKEAGLDPNTSVLREERYLLPGGRGARHLVLQVRWRDPGTRQIVRVAPDQRIVRRRVSSRA